VLGCLLHPQKRTYLRRPRRLIPTAVVGGCGGLQLPRIDFATHNDLTTDVRTSERRSHESADLAINARDRDDLGPWPGRDIACINEAPGGNAIIVHAKVMPDGRGDIQPGFSIECVQRFDRIAENEIKVILAARSDVLPLGEARPTVQ
jgi:hypothetical protein